MDINLTYKRFGEKAILIEWKPIIDEDILDDILLFKGKIVADQHIKYVDLIQGYHSLTIIYQSYIIDFKKKVSILKTIYTSTLKLKKQAYFQWKIPVCYDLAFGIDLEELSQKCNLEIDEIIKLHSEKTYRICFIGFLPGFLYLGGLNRQLFFDRKPNPRLKVPKGAVGIGGMQTGIYPNDSAGGWNIIGKTPIDFFNVENTVPCFTKAGDCIKFEPISVDEFYQLEKEIATKKQRISKILLNA